MLERKTWARGRRGDADLYAHEWARGAGSRPDVHETAEECNLFPTAPGSPELVKTEKILVRLFLQPFRNARMLPTATEVYLD